MTLVKVRYEDITPYKTSAEHLATLLPQMVADGLTVVKAEDVRVEVWPMAEWERIGYDLTIDVETPPWPHLRGENLEHCTNTIAGSIKVFLYDIYSSKPTRPKSRVDVRILPFHRVEI